MHVHCIAGNMHCIAKYWSFWTTADQRGQNPDGNTVMANSYIEEHDFLPICMLHLLSAASFQPIPVL